MKKLLAFILILALCILPACKKKDKVLPSVDPSAEESSAVSSIVDSSEASSAEESSEDSSALTSSEESIEDSSLIVSTENTNTIGRVDISIISTFSGKISLFPGDTFESAVNIKNTGARSAFVRFHFAVPDFQEDGKNINIIDIDFEEKSVANGEWIWGKSIDSNHPVRDGGEWNQTHGFTINGIPYKAYCVTYETALLPNTTTATNAFHQIRMPVNISNNTMTAWLNLCEGSNQSLLYLFAEGVQADGFDNAVDALNTAFGEPTSDYYQNLGWK